MSATYRITQVTVAGVYEGTVTLDAEPEDIYTLVYAEGAPRLDMRGTEAVVIVKVIGDE